MPTSVHFPQPLLEALDRRAQALKISRNRLIVQAVEREVTAGADWSLRFFEILAPADQEITSAVDELVAAVQSTRRSKKAPVI
jgi:metal-responsive CopG/Arc/MetJ family transcriptional regulator